MKRAIAAACCSEQGQEMIVTKRCHEQSAHGEVPGVTRTHSASVDARFASYVQRSCVLGDPFSGEPARSSRTVLGSVAWGPGSVTETTARGRIRAHISGDRVTGRASSRGVLPGCSPAHRRGSADGSTLAWTGGAARHGDPHGGWSPVVAWGHALGARV